MSLGIRISYFVASFLLLVSYCNGRYAAPKKHDFHPQEEVYQAALYEATTQGIENQYVVVLKVGTKVEKHLETIRRLLTRDDKILNTFTILKFTGYDAIVTKTTLETLRKNKEVQYIEQSTTSEDDCTTQDPAQWGLVRTSTRDLPLGNAYKYKNTGEGVVVYVIESEGVDTTHTEFEGRASWGKDYVHPLGDPNYQKATSDHGTHVTGIAISKTYGVAKKAKAVVFKVKETGQGIKAIEFSTDHHKKDTNPNKKRAVINMSISIPTSRALNDAVDNAVDEGLVLIASAGNKNQDACTQSPASASKVITVMNSQSDDTRRSTSNFGTCAHLYAPGTGIISTFRNNAIGTMSGTSMAAPHVAGVVARYLSSFPPNQQPTPAAVKQWLLNSALLKIVDGLQPTKKLKTGSGGPATQLKPLLHYYDC